MKLIICDLYLYRKSVLERIGGKANLHKIVVNLQESLVNDTVFGPIYQKEDAQKLIRNFTSYLMFLFSDSSPRLEKSLNLAHKSFKLTDMHFDRFLILFGRAMSQYNVDAESAIEASKLVDSKRDEVLQRDSLYTRLGGKKFMEKFIAIFNEKVLNDSILKSIHKGVDQMEHRETLRDFFTQLFGGYRFYSGNVLTGADAPLQWVEEDFLIFVMLVEDTLRKIEYFWGSCQGSC